MMPIWGRIAELLQHEGRLALVSVIETTGSTPREVGARMVVLADGSYSGTIGGGALEWQAIGAAQAALAGSGSGVAIRDFALGPELGQCCGGRLKLAIERLGEGDLALAKQLSVLEGKAPVATVTQLTAAGWRRRVATPAEVAVLGAAPALRMGDGSLLQRYGDERTPVYLFGAGHVGRAVMLALAPLPFRLTWIDPRPNAFPARVAGDVVLQQPSDPAGCLAAAPDGAFVLVMTHSHALDLDIVAAALSVRRFGYIGLIGSLTKRARFLRRLREASLGEAAERDLVCPIGLGTIHSKLPAAIAAGIAADLLVRREQAVAVRAPAADRRAHG